MSDSTASTRSEDSPRGKPPTWRIEGAPAGKGTNPTTGPRKPSDMYNKWRPFMLLGITIMVINLLTVGQFVRQRQGDIKQRGAALQQREMETA